MDTEIMVSDDAKPPLECSWLKIRFSDYNSQQQGYNGQSSGYY